MESRTLAWLGEKYGILPSRLLAEYVEDPWAFGYDIQSTLELEELRDEEKEKMKGKTPSDLKETDTTKYVEGKISGLEEIA